MERCNTRLISSYHRQMPSSFGLSLSTGLKPLARFKESIQVLDNWHPIVQNWQGAVKNVDSAASNDLDTLCHTRFPHFIRAYASGFSNLNMIPHIQAVMHNSPPIVGAYRWLADLNDSLSYRRDLSPCPTTFAEPTSYINGVLIRCC